MESLQLPLGLCKQINQNGKMSCEISVIMNKYQGTAESLLGCKAEMLIQSAFRVQPSHQITLSECTLCGRAHWSGIKKPPSIDPFLLRLLRICFCS